MDERLRVLCDTGPLVAAFDPRDASHARCLRTFQELRGLCLTTWPVLTEAFWLLGPGSDEAHDLREMLRQNGTGVWPMGDGGLIRCFELMEKYADRPMDLADASLIAAAEELGTARFFTLDRKDFAVYRVRRGHRQVPVELV